MQCLGMGIGIRVFVAFQHACQALGCCCVGVLWRWSVARWNGPRCPELVAGSRKQVEVLVWSNNVGLRNNYLQAMSL